MMIGGNPMVDQDFTILLKVSKTGHIHLWIYPTLEPGMVHCFIDMAWIRGQLTFLEWLSTNRYVKKLRKEVVA